MKENHIGIRNLMNKRTNKLTGRRFKTHLKGNEKNVHTLSSLFLEFLYQPTFGTFRKSRKPSHRQSFLKESNFTSALIKIITFKEYNYGR